MGLENGFLVKGKTKEGQTYLKMKWGNEYDDFFKCSEFGYFRKFWGLRNEIRNILPECPVDEEGFETGNYILTINNIRDILQILKEFLNEDTYNNYSCLWEYHVGIRSIANTIYCLTELVNDIEYGNINEDDVEIIFYDSY